MPKAIPESPLLWMPKSLWGPLKWKELHSRAFLDRDMSGEKEWFHSFVISVPCPKCQAHFEAFIKACPPDFTSRIAFFRWGVEAHNYVNAATKKRLITLDEAYRMHHFLTDEEAP